MPTNIVLQFEKQYLIIAIFNHGCLIILLSVTFNLHNFICDDNVALANQNIWELFKISVANDVKIIGKSNN